MLIPKGLVLYHSGTPFPSALPVSISRWFFVSVLFWAAFSWQWCRGRMLGLYILHLTDFPCALHGFCTMQASSQRLILIPKLNNYQYLPIGWVKKLNPFLNLCFPVCQWGFRVYIGHLYYSCSSELLVLHWALHWPVQCSDVTRI